MLFTKKLILTVLTLAIMLSLGACAENLSKIDGGADVSITAIHEHKGSIIKDIEEIKLLSIALVVVSIPYPFLVAAVLSRFFHKKGLSRHGSNGGQNQLEAPQTIEIANIKRPVVRDAATTFVITVRGKLHGAISSRAAASGNAEDVEVITDGRGEAVSALPELLGEDSEWFDNIYISEQFASDEIFAGKKYMPPEMVMAAIMQTEEASPSQGGLPQEAEGFIDDDAIGRTERGQAQETPFGNFCADALVYTTGADIGFVNSGGVIADTKADGITRDSIPSEAPFDDTIAVLGLKGIQVKSVLEHSVSMLPEADGRFMQISGIIAEFDAAMPVGSRLVSVTLSDGFPVVDNREYIVATTDYIARGGEGFYFLAGLPMISEGITLEQACLRYLDEKGVKDYVGRTPQQRPQLHNGHLV